VSVRSVEHPQTLRDVVHSYSFDVGLSFVAVASKSSSLAKLAVAGSHANAVVFDVDAEPMLRLEAAAQDDAAAVDFRR
jgi:hypothetical protein